MNIFGLRVSPKEIFYSIVDTEQSKSIHQKLIVPKSLDISQQLSYIRKTLLDILNQYEISSAGIKIAENNATPDIDRIRIEGVILETLASSNLNAYFFGVKSSIGKSLRLGDHASMANYITGTTIFNNFESWSTYTNIQRECILAAFASAES